MFFPDSAPSLLMLTGKGLLPLSSLSFSCSAFSADTRNVSDSGRSVLPLPDSRRQRTLYEPDRAINPDGHVWLWSASRWGICNKSDLLRTRFESNRFAELHDKVFSARPHSRRAKVHEIEFGYYSRLVTGDYFQKPLSNVSGHSRGTTLYGTQT